MFLRKDTTKRDVIISPDDLGLDEGTIQLIKVNNIKLRIRVIDTGDYTKPALVFIHGMGACKEVFKAQIRQFSEKFRVIAMDLPGHGESLCISNIERLNDAEKAQLSAQLYNLPIVIAQVALTLRALKIKNACIMGWSIGGHISYGLAIKQPELTRCIVTNGSPPINYSLKTLKCGFSSWFVDNIVKDWLENPRHYSREDAEAIVKSMGYVEVKNEDNYFVEALMKADPLFRKYLYETLAKYENKPELKAKSFIETNEKIPLCFLEGKEDKGINVDYIRHCFETCVAKKQPDSQFHAFDSGHSVFRKLPQEFYCKLINFMDLVSIPENAKRLEERKHY